MCAPRHGSNVPPWPAANGAVPHLRPTCPAGPGVVRNRPPPFPRPAKFMERRTARSMLLGAANPKPREAWVIVTLRKGDAAHRAPEAPPDLWLPPRTSRLVAVRTGPSARGKRTLIRATSGCSWWSAPSVPATECSLGDKARRARSWANCCPDGEHRRCGVRTRDRQGERSGLHDLNRVLDGCRAPTGSVVQLARDLGLLGDRRWATRS